MSGFFIARTIGLCYKAFSFMEKYAKLTGEMKKDAGTFDHSFIR